MHEARELRFLKLSAVGAEVICDNKEEERRVCVPNLKKTSWEGVFRVCERRS